MTVSSVICISGCVYEFPQSVDLCCGHAHAYLGAPDPLSAFTHTCCGAGPGLVLGAIFKMVIKILLKDPRFSVFIKCAPED